MKSTRKISFRGTCAVALAVAGLLGWSVEAQLVPGTRIETRVRPAVTLQYNGGAGVAVGIMDTGDPRLTFSRETGRLLGIGPVTPINPSATPPAPNLGTTAAQNITSGGWFGATLSGPELNTPAAPAWPDLQIRAGDPAHVFTTATTLANSQPVVSNGLRNFYRDFPAGGGGFSENHAGMPFVTRADVRQNLVMMVDPINSTPLPFAYDNTNAGNGRGLGGASNPLDSRTSSVSYFANNALQVPTRAKNANPDFVTFVELIPTEFGSSTMTPAPASAVQNNALPAGVDRRLTMTVAAADAAAVVGFSPFSALGLSPGYRPNDAAGNTPAVNNIVFEVRNNGALGTLNIGGQENPNGFQLRDGSVTVEVRSDAVGNPLVLAQNIVLPSQAPRPHGVINIPELGINTGAAPLLIDSGAPDTDATIIGTDILNRFGQYWDFSPRGAAGATANRGLLTLVGPKQRVVREMLGNGMLMSVDAGTDGLQRTAINHEKTIGTVPQLNAGGAGIAAGGDGTPGQATSTIFRTHLTGSNAAYVEEGALGFLKGGNVIMDGMSLGGDKPAPNGEVLVSVSRTSVGIGGTAVAQQAALNQVAADVFSVGPRNRANARAGMIDRTARLNNRLLINQEVMGIGPNVGPGFAAAASTENMLDFDLETFRALPGNSLSNLDSPLNALNDFGAASRPRVGLDVVGASYDVYLSQSNDARIFMNDQVLAEVFTMGLFSMGFDDIDALAMYRPSVKPGVRGDALLDRGLNRIANSLMDGIFDPNYEFDFSGIDLFNGFDSDVAIFSLSPGSAKLGQYGLSAADLFITDFDGTFALYATAESMGLNFGDNIDGLDVLVPEPTSVCTLAVMGLLMGRRRRA